jgi:16S rRNA (guanine1207-N2)-methyltransferase
MLEGTGWHVMAEHYSTVEPTSKVREIPFETDLNGQKLQFVSVSGVFSFEPRIDKASFLLIKAFTPSRPDGAVLDVGCGFGPIGLCIKAAFPRLTVTMADINSRAVEYAVLNAQRNNLHVEIIQSDLYSGLALRKFDDVVCNPPIAAGKAVNMQLIREAADHLAPAGSLWLTAFHNKGGETLKKIMAEVFGNVADMVKSGGIRVYRSSLG